MSADVRLGAPVSSGRRSLREEKPETQYCVGIGTNIYRARAYNH